MSNLTWEEIEKAYTETLKDLQSIEESLNTKNIPKDEKESLSYQLESIYKMVKSFEEQKEKLHKE